MSTNETSSNTPTVSPGNYSPVTVTMNDTVGTIFLGVLSAILLIQWLRSESRYRALTNHSHSTNNG